MQQIAYISPAPESAPYTRAKRLAQAIARLPGGLFVVQNAITRLGDGATWEQVRNALQAEWNAIQTADRAAESDSE